MEVVLATDAGELQRALHHAKRRVAVTVHDAVAERAVVRADAHGAFQLDGFQHQRRELFLDAPQLFSVLRVGVFFDREFLRVRIVAGIHADDFHPLHRFHRCFRFEMDVRDDRNIAAALAKFGDDVLQVRRVLHRRCCDADELATDGDEFKRLFHAGRRVHRVAGDHGLRHDRMIPADDDASARGIADDDFARLTTLENVGRLAVAHGKSVLRGECDRCVRLAIGVRTAHPIADVVERDPNHETD